MAISTRSELHRPPGADQQAPRPVTAPGVSISTAIQLGVCLLLLTVVACANQSAAPTPVTAPPERSAHLAPTHTPAEIEAVTHSPTSVPLPTPTPTPVEIEVVTPTPTNVPLPAPTPTPSETEAVTPTPTSVPPPTPMPILDVTEVHTLTDFGYNTRVVDGDIHVWHAPPCPQIHSASWIAAIILTDLRTGSYLYLDPDGSGRKTPGTDYWSDETRERFAEVLEDVSLLELIITPFECPLPPAPGSETMFCTGLTGWPDPDTVNIGEPPFPQVAISSFDSLGGFCMGHGWTGSYCWQAGVKGRTCEAREDWDELIGVRAYAMAKESHTGVVTVLGDESSPGRVTGIQLFPVLVEEPEFELGEEAYSLFAQEGESIAQFELPDVSEGVYLLITSYESPLGHVEHGFKVELRNRRARE